MKRILSKNSLLILVILFAISCQKSKQQSQSDQSQSDPVEALRQVISDMPVQAARSVTVTYLHNEANDNGRALTMRVSDVKFDVTKTDSLVSPIVAVIEYTPIGSDIHQRMRSHFAWQDKQWKYQSSEMLHNNHDDPDWAFKPYVYSWQNTEGIFTNVLGESTTAFWDDVIKLIFPNVPR